MSIHCSARWAGLLLLLLLPITVTAESSPAMPKDGVCPIGYHTEGRYCVASRANHTEGRYCVANRANAPSAIPKNGVCPSGYHTEGRYCVSN